MEQASIKNYVLVLENSCTEEFKYNCSIDDIRNNLPEGEQNKCNICSSKFWVNEEEENTQ